MNQDAKFSVFLEITKQLNSHGIVPTVYGSLGLYRIIDQIDEVDDIDIILPKKYLNEQFSEMVSLMAELGYYVDPVFPHEFTRGDGQVGFEPEGELIEYAGIDYDKRITTKIDGVEFQEFRPEEYLKIYRKVLEEREAKVTKDRRKIEALENLLR